MRDDVNLTRITACLLLHVVTTFAVNTISCLPNMYV